MQYGFLGHGLAVPPDVGVLRLGVAVLGGDLPRAVGVVGVAVDGRGVQVGLPAGGLDVRGPGGEGCYSGEMYLLFSLLQW